MRVGTGREDRHVGKVRLRLRADRRRRSRAVGPCRARGRAGPERRLHHVAWQLAAYFVVGADASLEGIRPRRPFAPGRGDFGALELAARLHTLDLDDLTFPAYANPDVSVTRARALGAGVHWYVNGNLKVSADFEHSWFKGGDGPDLDDDVDLDGDDDENRAPETVVLLRVQLAF